MAVREVEEAKMPLGVVEKTGYNPPGVPTNGRKPHLGDIILNKFYHLIREGREDLEQFELIDRLEKPVMYFVFSGTKRQILEVNKLLQQHPYAFAIKTNLGYDLSKLPEKYAHTAQVYISRFPHLIKFISKYESTIPSDLWGILFGYKLNEVHLYTYDWVEWAKIHLPDRVEGKRDTATRDFRVEI